jgi:hypothetical protein
LPKQDTPEWFIKADEAFHPIYQRVGAAVDSPDLPHHLSLAPLEAFYFFVHSMKIAQDANRMGIHANALYQTRSCIEALAVIELGICRKSGREEILEDWLTGKASAGKVRKWLATQVWPSYGLGLWSECWEEFIAKLARAVQPYAHYTSQLAQWQSRLHKIDSSESNAYIEIGPVMYDTQKATRITLYHSILHYTLGRVWIANSTSEDKEFREMVCRLGDALGRSRYLDGHQTDWDQQFWALVWDRRTGSTHLE